MVASLVSLSLDIKQAYHSPAIKLEAEFLRRLSYREEGLDCQFL